MRDPHGCVGRLAPRTEIRTACVPRCYPENQGAGRSPRPFSQVAKCAGFVPRSCTRLIADDEGVVYCPEWDERDFGAD